MRILLRRENSDPLCPALTLKNAHLTRFPGPLYNQ